MGSSVRVVKWHGRTGLGSYALIGETDAHPTMENKADSLIMALMFMEDREGEGLQVTTLFRRRLKSS